MGKGLILGGGEAGLYDVKVQYNPGKFYIKEANLISIILTLGVELAKVQAQIAEIQTTQDELQTRMNDASLAISDLTADNPLLAQRQAELADEVADIKDQISAYEHATSLLEKALSGLETRRDELESKIAASGDPEEIAALQEELDTVNASIATTSSSINSNNNAVETLGTQLTLTESEYQAVSSQLSDNESQIEAKRNDIESAIAEIQQSEIERLALVANQNVLELKKLAAEKDKAALLDIPKEKTISAWCADYSEELTGTVGLIEVPGEPTYYNIRPGYQDQAVWNPERDGQLMKIESMTPAQFFFNFAMLTTWQKWIPTYRYGTITSISGDTATVTLENIKSSRYEVEINQASILYNVPIYYMNCNGFVFKIGDEVLIQFLNQTFENPIIIGFKKEPKSCDRNLMYMTFTDVEGTLGIIVDLRKEEFYPLRDYKKPGEIIAQPFNLSIYSLDDILNYNGLECINRAQAMGYGYGLEQVSDIPFINIHDGSFDNSYKTVTGMICNFNGPSYNCRSFKVEITDTLVDTIKVKKINIPDFNIGDTEIIKNYNYDKEDRVHYSELGFDIYLHPDYPLPAPPTVPGGYITESSSSKRSKSQENTIRLMSFDNDSIYTKSKYIKEQIQNFDSAYKVTIFNEVISQQMLYEIEVVGTVYDIKGEKRLEVSQSMPEGVSYSSLPATKISYTSSGYADELSNLLWFESWCLYIRGYIYGTDGGNIEDINMFCDVYYKLKSGVDDLNYDMSDYKTIKYEKILQFFEISNERAINALRAKVENFLPYGFLMAGLYG